MTATVLVIGGTGTLGEPVVTRLREQGYQVRLLVRDPGRANARVSGFEHVAGTSTTPARCAARWMAAPNTTAPHGSRYWPPAPASAA